MKIAALKWRQALNSVDNFNTQILSGVWISKNPQKHKNVINFDFVIWWYIHREWKVSDCIILNGALQHWHCIFMIFNIAYPDIDPFYLRQIKSSIAKATQKNKCT